MHFSLRSRHLRPSLLASSLLLAVSAQGQEKLDVDLPAAPLGQAINALAQQSSVQILFAGDLGAGRQAPALKGRFTPEEALRQLLRDSGLKAQARDEHTFIVVPASEAAVPATQARSEPLDMEQMEITASRTSSDLVSATRQSTVIEHAQLEELRQGSDSLATVLAKAVPGMSDSSRTITEYGQTLRGRSMLVMVDGVPLNTNRDSSRNLAKHLQGPLAPVYVVSGDEPLLCQEACDAIRQACRERDFGERQVFNAEANFDWGLLLEAGASLSLFAEKRLIELRLPSGKPGDKGAAILQEYLQRPPEDTVLLLSLPKLDGSTQKTKWAKALIDGNAAQFIQVWPVDVHQLPQWIRQRLSQAGLSASPEALELIAARVEGNLLAAAQEIEKLKLLAEGNQIDAATVQAAVADSARFDVFGLIDAALGGEAAHALRILEGLRGEGIEPPVILWGLAREIRLLAGLSQQYGQGIPLEKAFAQARPPVWDKRRPLLTRALQRHSSSRWNQMLRDAQLIDAQIKGQAPGSPWSGLSLLALSLAGQRLGLPAA